MGRITTDKRNRLIAEEIERRGLDCESEADVEEIESIADEIDAAAENEWEAQHDH